MKNLKISFDSEIDPKYLHSMSKDTIRIFEWVCGTLNVAGYVPHIYEADHKSMKFVLRKFEGAKVNIRFDIQMKIVSLANYIFKVKQQTWPVVVTQDIQDCQLMSFWRINVTGEARSIMEEFDSRNPFVPSKEATTLSLPG